MLSKIKKLPIIEKIFILITIFFIIISIVSLLKVFTQIAFYIFSIWALFFIIFIIYKVAKICNVNLNKKDYIIIGIAVLIITSIYIYIISTRQYIYTWDDDIYYRAQIDLLDKFNSSFLSGIKSIISTTYRSDYGYFLLSFTSGIFSLTNKSPDAFVYTYSIISITFIITIFMLIVKKLANNNTKNEVLLVAISSMSLILFPLLNKTSIMGQPDFFGLIFAGLIILLLMDYRFLEIELKRWMLILICTFCLLITRRWYMFFALGYFVSYAIITIIKVLISKDKIKIKHTIKNALLFIILAIIVLGVLVGPIIYRTLKNNYANTYQAWSTGGAISEFKSQFYKIGLFYCLIILTGMIYGIKNKKTRYFTIEIISTILIAILAFTRIQNMGDHHSLILWPSYFILFTIGLICILNINKKSISITLISIVIMLDITNFYVSITENNLYGNKLFTNISLKPNKRDDMDNMKNMVDFIIENCNIDNKAYINAATGEYCRDAFSNYYLPEHADLQDIIVYESSVDSAHGFPVDLFTCKYVFISNIILESTGATPGHIIPNITYAIQEDNIISKKYKKVDEFKMTDNITFYAYERIEKFTEEERNEWLNLFEEESILYPNMFRDKIIDIQTK